MRFVDLAWTSTFTWMLALNDPMTPTGARPELTQTTLTPDLDSRSTI